MSNRPNKASSSAVRARAAGQGSGGGNVGLWIVIGVIVAIGGVLIAAVVIASGSDDGGGGDPSVIAGDTPIADLIVQGEPTIAGTPLSDMPSSGPDPDTGKPVPTLTGQAFDGSPIAIGADGEPKVIIFVAHWCPHCQAEVPRLTEHLAATGMPEGVALYAVATGTNEGQPNFPPGEWLAEEGWPVPTLVDSLDGTAAQAFGLTGFPYFVVVDADGNLVERTSGELTTEQFDALVAAARTGQPSSSAGGASSAG